MGDLPYPEDRGGTHSQGCYRWPHHHNCAVLEVERLREEVADRSDAERKINATLKAEIERADAAEAELNALRQFLAGYADGLHFSGKLTDEATVRGVLRDAAALARAGDGA